MKARDHERLMQEAEKTIRLLRKELEAAYRDRDYWKATAETYASDYRQLAQEQTWQAQS